MQPQDIEDLIERYNSGMTTPAENALVESWYLKYKHSDPYLSQEQLEEDQKESLDKLLNEIQGGAKRIQLSRWAIAASILFFMAVGGYFFSINNNSSRQIAAVKPQKYDVAPGGNKAILTLGDGSTIVLNSAKIGKLARQDNIIIKKAADGQISYNDVSGSHTSKSEVYNTAATPQGGQYQFILADGTKVWLNASSTIKYPVVFNAKERRVELTGEAYFEVAHNAKKPFKVISNGQTVEVLGTHFNINAYNDEQAVKTTLLEGSVKVSAGKVSNIIKPGQQARFDHGSIDVMNVDPDEVVAWKNGFFFFEDNNIQEVMRQLSRWYGVEIKYEGQLPSRRFSGEISRNVNLSQILDILSFKQIHYKIDGKTIIVMN
ncbi:FecR protein [Mucilaginibacter gossypiicola]|uniref:FecR protein n=1 Tax=Mucilaginibacter gossypiicola TaxID=551995 RepID=A0A1H8BL59_9SPHI|nr:FecR domain-containing protein [Mucilaginibacter gossypiicola]SEM83526.1 FecR protein [Mucilaginibacter gossypiicola]